MKTRGFTLIELMIVVAILGIILTLILPTFGIGVEKVETFCHNGYMYRTEGSGTPVMIEDYNGVAISCQPE